MCSVMILSIIRGIKFRSLFFIVIRIYGWTERLILVSQFALKSKITKIERLKYIFVVKSLHFYCEVLIFIVFFSKFVRYYIYFTLT